MVLEFIAGAALGGLAFGGGSHTTNYVSTGPSHVDVHEHRAPTDDSVKLLREMEEKARNQIVGAFVTNKDNDFDGAVVYMRPSVMSADYNVYTRFKLNGQEYEFKEVVTDIAFHMSKEEAYRKLAEKLSAVMTNKLMYRLISEAHRV